MDRRKAEEWLRKLASGLMRPLATVFCCPLLIHGMFSSRIEHCSAGRMQRQERERAMREREANRPAPLPARRRELSGSATYRAQGPGCRLLNTLPAEIRLQIWTYVLGGQHLHLLQGPKRVAHIRCSGLQPLPNRFCCPVSIAH